MPVRRCTAPGCGRFIRGDETWCARHHPAAGWRASDDEHENVQTELLHEVASEFRRRMERGDYRELLGPNVRTVIQQASEEHGLTDEIGILRVVLAKLLLEEHDGPRLAESVARVVAASVQAARARRTIEGGTGESIADSVTQILIDLGLGE